MAEKSRLAGNCKFKHDLHLRIFIFKHKLWNSRFVTLTNRMFYFKTSKKFGFACEELRLSQE